MPRNSFLTPEERTLRSRIGGYTATARNGGHAQTEAARKVGPTADAYWARVVDPDEKLPVEERAKRARAAKSAHFARLALKKSQDARRNSA